MIYTSFNIVTPKVGMYILLTTCRKHSLTGYLGDDTVIDSSIEQSGCYICSHISPQLSHDLQHKPQCLTTEYSGKYCLLKHFKWNTHAACHRCHCTKLLYCVAVVRMIMYGVLDLLILNTTCTRSQLYCLTH